MSCGLGAILLVFMLIKENVDRSFVEADRLAADLQTLQEDTRRLEDRLAAVRAETGATRARIATVSQRIVRVEADLARAERTLAARRGDKAALERAIRETEPPKPPDVIEDPQPRDVDYLIGLKVEGPRIGILVDASASMTDDRLIDIIRRKNRGDAEKRSGPKWRRTKRIVKWLLGRVPESSEVSVVAYAAQARTLGGRPWIAGGDGAGLERVLGELETVVPEGATNLEAGLAAIAARKPTNLYIVTDGLPTAGESGYRSLNPFSDCSALWGASTKISGACRAALFRHSVDEAAPSKTVANVILLPIEGDPAAADEYWRWTWRTGGILISPAGSWP